jgi:hypothetical protein
MLVLRRTFCPKKYELIGDWRKFNDEELPYFYFFARDNYTVDAKGD